MGMIPSEALALDSIGAPLYIMLEVEKEIEHLALTFAKSTEEIPLYRSAGMYFSIEELQACQTYSKKDVMAVIRINALKRMKHKRKELQGQAMPSSRDIKETNDVLVTRELKSPYVTEIARMLHISEEDVLEIMEFSSWCMAPDSAVTEKNGGILS
ncbi:hypothetical protein [Bacillus sp. FJAT-44742]|uniref:hypothetical protein n=1 Tax=Bacillus sp. FJAT-44742 TaxID=2014005 RepID=UPI000C240B72|nr:hypothetical protein [Bacillus sp. FJAT-44742]